MDLSTIGNVASITMICFLAGMTVSKSKLDNKWIPVIVGALGGIIGALGLFVIPNYPADNLISAIAVGIESGLASTGVHQAYKQIRENAKGENNV